MKTKEEILKEKGISNWSKFHNYDFLYKSILECMEEYSNQSKWISVDERVPEESGEVLTCMNESFSIYISFYRKGRNIFEVYGLGRAQPITDMNVTHWQPLPTAPIQ